MARGKFNKRGGANAGSAGGRGRGFDRKNQSDDLWGWNTIEQEDKKTDQDSASGSESGSGSDDEAPVQQMKILEIKGQPSKQTGDSEEGEEKEDDKQDKVENPNHQAKTHFKVSDMNVSAPRELSRREREAKEKKDAQARYWKLHMEGKTDQAKSDLARLATIRKKREEAAAAKKAEAEIKEAEQKAKNVAKTSGVIKNRYGF